MLVRSSLTFGFASSLIMAVGLVTLTPKMARAQSTGQMQAPADAPATTPPPTTLPPLPPSQDPPPQADPPQADPPQADPPRSAEPPPTVVAVAPPPTVIAQSDEPTGKPYDEPKHAPKFSLYAGVNIGVIGYGGSFFQNNLNNPETTGNIVGNGLSFELDAGARLGYRYIPYVMWEHAFLATGARLDGTSAHASSDFIGLGFRLLSFDVDNVAFLSDIAIGFRSVTVANDTGSFKMSALEIGRLGLGAEIRLSTLVTISPIARVSIGQMSDSSGSITYGPNQGDGQKQVSFIGDQINSAPLNYFVFGLGCGGQFDFFGK